MKVKTNKKNIAHATDCLVETLTILSNKGIIDVDTALDFINTNNLQGLHGYLTGIRLMEEKR